MKKAVLFVHKAYLNNEIFNPESPLNRDNCLEFFHELKKQFWNYGVELHTQDQVSLKEASFVIYNEIPDDIAHVSYPEKSAALLFESELIRPNDWKLQNHNYFKYIFTWNDTFVDNQKYFKFNFTHGGGVVFKPFAEKKKFCTLVAGNKKVVHPLELYSKRIEAIRWFEKNHPDLFEFFGMGWNLHTFNIPIISRVLNRIKPLRAAFAEEWPSYRGAVKNKLDLLQNYKFSICYENAEGIPGYITEKILDSLAAGCIPIYWGASNIENFIPRECFIHKPDFKTYEDLYTFLKSMSESDYNQRLAAIQSFLGSGQHQAFEPSPNAAIVVERLVGNA